MTRTEEEYRDAFLNFLYYLAIHNASLTQEQKLIHISDFVYYNVDEVTKYSIPEDTFFGNKVGTIYEIIENEIPTARKNLEESKDVKCWSCLDFFAKKNEVNQEDMKFCICRGDEDE